MNKISAGKTVIIFCTLTLNVILCGTATASWEIVNPLASLHSIWGISNSDIYAVGDCRILHYDGNHWTVAYDDIGINDTDFRGVWGDSPNDVYVVAKTGTGDNNIFHYNGTNLTPMNSGSTKNLNDIWGSSDNDIYAVGDNGTILHYNGSNWSSMNINTTDDLHCVWGFSRNEVFAGGDMKIFRFNGSTWSEMAMHPDAEYVYPSPPINGIWGSSSTNIYAVATSSASGIGGILHYDGNIWSMVEWGTGYGVDPLKDIWGISENEIFIAGTGGILRHENGSFHMIETNPNYDYLERIWGTSSDNIYAVGSMGEIVHYNGSQYYQMDGGIAGINRIWGTSSNDIHAAGITHMIHYDGNKWSEIYDLCTSNRYAEIFDIWGNSGSNVFAVGFKDDGNPDGNIGLILRYDGNAWSEIAGDIPVELYGVWGSSNNNVFFVGPYGKILNYRNGSLIEMNSNTSADLYDVWGSSDNNVFAVGYGENNTSVILRYDGNNWTEIKRMDGIVDAVWVSQESDVYVAVNGSILHSEDYINWTTIRYSEEGEEYLAIWGYSATDIYFGGRTMHNEGFIYKYDKSDFYQMEVGFGMVIDIWGSSPENIYAVGGSPLSYMFHYDGTTPETTTTTSILDVECFSDDDCEDEPCARGICLDGQCDLECIAIGPTDPCCDDLNCLGASVCSESQYVWTPQDSGGEEWLRGIWSSASNQISTTGINGTLLDANKEIFVAGSKGTILRSDGNGWTLMDSGTSRDLIDIWGTSSTNIYAVGDHFLTVDGNGIILHYNGSTWSEVLSGVHPIYAIWGSSLTDIFAVTMYGEIDYHYDGSSWTEMDMKIELPTDIWGLSSSNVYTVGWDGEISHYDGHTWSPMESGTNNILWGIWGNSTNNIFAVGGFGTILHFDGQTWSAMQSGTMNHLWGISGCSSSNVFAVGENGIILHYDGKSWATMQSNIEDQTLFSVLCVADNEVYTVGGEGTILHYGEEQQDSGTCPSREALNENERGLSVLRKFRDDVLRKSPEGRELIKLYYQWSPMIIKAMKADEDFKKEIKGMIDAVLPMIEVAVE